MFTKNLMSMMLSSSENHHKECLWSAPDRLYGGYSQAEGF